MTADSMLVVDASVAVKWYVPEEGSSQAAALLEEQERFLAPDLIVPELGNIVWKKARWGELTPEEGKEIIEAFTMSSPVVLRASRSLLAGAFDLAHEYGRPVYDMLYLALAVSEGCRLVTADARLGHALEYSPFETSLLVLEGA